MHMISQKKKIMNLIPFHKQNFQIHFVNVFLTHPLDQISVKDFDFENFVIMGFLEKYGALVTL